MVTDQRHSMDGFAVCTSLVESGLMLVTAVTCDTSRRASVIDVYLHTKYH